MKKTIIVAGALMLFFPLLSNAQSLPMTAVETDAASLGTAGASLTDTKSVAYAAFGNPAAVTFSEIKMDAAAGYTMWGPTGAGIINAAGAYNLDGKLGFAAGFQYGMNKPYDIIDGSGAVKGSFTPSDMRLNAGFSYRFLSNVSAGVNLGYASSTLAEGYSYGAVEADVYAMAEFSDLSVVLGVTNLGTGVTSATVAKFSLPAAVALGAGYNMEFAQKHTIDLRADVDYYLQDGVAAAFGAEYLFDKMVAVRAGYRYGGQSVMPSFVSVGAGVKYSGIRLDVAYLAGSSAMANTLALSLGYSF